MKKLLSIFIIILVIVLVSIVSINILTLKKYSSLSKNNPDQTRVLTPRTSTPDAVTTTTPATSTPIFTLPSRTIFESVQAYVSKKQLTLPEATRLYAYAATAYADTFTLTQNESLASDAVLKIALQMYPDFKKTMTSSALMPSTPLNSKIDWLKYLSDREKSDGFHNLVWDGKIPTGAGKWKKSNGTPIFPMAGEWQRWITSSTPEIDAKPLVFGSIDYQIELQKLKKQISNEILNQETIVDSLNITSSTTDIAQIWQNKLWKIFSTTKTTTTVENDLLYSNLQKLLAQTVADATMNCWEIKYNFWTDSTNKLVETSSTTNNFSLTPSFPTENAFVSGAAKEILVSFFPTQKTEIINFSQSIRDASLFTGYHFDYDNQAGYKLGEILGKEVLEKQDSLN
jgi:hypothetical protein